jgi:signal transduction histidine kinase
MDLRLVIHRGLTIAIAMLMSLVPIVIVLALFWPTLADRFAPNELLILLLAIVGLSLLIAPTRDIAGRVLDKYVYRTQANFQRTVREASQVLTRVLDLGVILTSVSDAVAASTEPEGVAIYLRTGPRFSKAITGIRYAGASFDAPEAAPAVVVEALSQGRDSLVTEEVARERTAERQRLHSELARLNWALVLPLLSENTVIGLIALGPKLSWDPFYPHDLDLLMTLANQAGTAIKNAQLYTQVVLANEFIENVVATIESGVVAIDAAGHVTMFNRAAAQLTRLPAEGVKNQSADVLPADLEALLKSTVADGRERTQPEIALPDGAVTRPVICTTSPLRDPAGVILGAVAVFSDLTPFKQLESERQRAARLAYFEVLASSLAHEIKNPLVAIKTFAQLIPRRQSDALFADEFSRIVTREIGRMERLVEQLRTLSRPSDRPKQRLDVREPLAQAVEFLRPAFDEKRISTGTSLGAEPRFVLGDHGELEQLFINLLMNACEATPPGGTLSIELTATGDHVAVALADSGPGIPPELLEHVFDPFITTKQRGSGLGLTICAGIAAAHRAKLRAANRAAGGALLTAEFPLAVAAQATSEVRDRDVNARA